MKPGRCPTGQSKVEQFLQVSAANKVELTDGNQQSFVQRPMDACHQRAPTVRTGVDMDKGSLAALQLLPQPDGTIENKILAPARRSLHQRRTTA